MKIPNGLNSLLLVALIVLAAAIPRQVSVPVEFYKLVEDKMNVLLLMTLCILVSYCNFPLGVMMSLFIFMVMVNNPNIEGFEDKTNTTDSLNTTQPDTTNTTDSLNTTQSDSTTVNKCDPESPDYDPGHPDCQTNTNNTETKNNTQTETKSNSQTNTQPVVAQSQPAEYVDYGSLDGFLINLRNAYMEKDNTAGAAKFCEALKRVKDSVKCPIENFSANNDILNSLSKGINNLASENQKINNTSYNDLDDLDEINEGFMGAMSNEPRLNSNKSEDFMKMQLNEQTKHASNNSNSNFDVVGCRYDLKANLNNEFVQGPPLTNCAIYDMATTTDIGCEFYPINP